MLLIYFFSLFILILATGFRISVLLITVQTSLIAFCPPMTQILSNRNRLVAILLLYDTNYVLHFRMDYTDEHAC